MAFRRRYEAEETRELVGRGRTTMLTTMFPSLCWSSPTTSSPPRSPLTGDNRPRYRKPGLELCQDRLHGRLARSGRRHRTSRGFTTTTAQVSVLPAVASPDL